MQNVIQDLRYAFRMFRQNPGFTTVILLTLALGIGANTAVFTVVNAVLLKPLPFPDANRLMLISLRNLRNPMWTGPRLGDADYVEFVSRQKSFENLTTFNNWAMTLTGSGDPVRLKGAGVTKEFLSVMRVRPAIGRDFLPEEEQEGDEDDHHHPGASPVLGLLFEKIHLEID